MAQSIKPQLMFEGQAEQAIRFYASLFADSAILALERHGPGETGAEGSVRWAELEIAGQTINVIDSPVRQRFGFTPALSLFVNCESLEELEVVYAQLADGGDVLMRIDDYGFSQRFGWVQDRFGVAWQLNLP